MTLAEKLENFKTMPVGFHVKTEEIACLLGKVMDSVGITGNNGRSPLFTMGMCWVDHGKSGELYVTMNHPLIPKGDFGDGEIGFSGEFLDEIYEVTVEELKEYLDTVGNLKKTKKSSCLTCELYSYYTDICDDCTSQQ